MATSPPSVGDIKIIGHSEVRVDFLNFKLGCVWGYKYDDFNGNGIKDTGEPGIPGWTIYLNKGDAMVDVTTTDGDGYYKFCGLKPGRYVVSEEGREGWVATTPSFELVEITSGKVVQIHDFMNYKYGKI